MIKDVPWQIIESAYNNGYEQGHKEASEQDYWGVDKHGNFYCPKCGTLAPDSFGLGDPVLKEHLNYCMYCGKRLIFKGKNKND